MNDFARAEKLHSGDVRGHLEAENELGQARELLAHAQTFHASTSDAHLLEAMDHVVNAVATLALEVGRVTTKG